MKRVSVFSVVLTTVLFSCNKENTSIDSGMGMGQPVSIIEGDFTTPLAIPAIVGASTTLSAQHVSPSILSFGNVSGLGYSSAGLLGPSIKVNSGSLVSINLENQLSEKTNIHWHGLKIPASMDGHPDNTVSAGSSFSYSFTVNQRAGLYWYHPHAEMLTGKQVFQGLAGLFIVNDSEETALNLPSGNREIPLVIQDKNISFGQIPYAPSMMEVMTGLMGHYVLVNGVYAPFHTVETATYRVRILNGSNARIYNLALSNGASFQLIGNDGGLLANPQTVSSLLLGPGERADLLIDFSQTALNSELFLISKAFNGGSSSQGTQEFKIMKFRTTTQTTDNFVLPSALSSIANISEAMATIHRNFDIQNTGMGMMGGGMTHTINDKVFDTDRIDENVANGAIEIWTFDNTNGAEPHPMHLHGVQFQILSRTGGRGGLTPIESGWKDMALCLPGEKVKIIVDFSGLSGKYLFHCHNLEHEDNGMMGQFRVN